MLKQKISIHDKGETILTYLSRSDLEAIGARVIRAYKKLPEVAGRPFEKVNIDLLVETLLGLRIDYRHLSPEGDRLGLTAFCEIGVEVFSKDPRPDDELYYMLDGSTILIEEDLIQEGANVGRRNYTISHEGCHHILKMLFPGDYGAQGSRHAIHYCCCNRRHNHDWEEWQVETLAGIILMPAECVSVCMDHFGLGTRIRLLNRVFASDNYRRFEEMAAFMGVSKTALSIRLTQLGKIARNDFGDPYALVRIEKDEEDQDL